MIGASRKLRLVLSGFLALLALTAIPASAEATIQLGAYTPGAPAEASALSQYAAMVGRQPDIVMWYREFGQPLMYSNEVANLRATGQTPMITWEPYEESLSAIASGSDDEYLHESAKIAAEWGGPLLIRFGHEMNGNWYPWGSASTTASTNAEAFVAAWRHIVSVFRADGATNVKWVWAPNVQEGSKYPIASSFPGEEYVDYVGLDGYNWGTNNGETWQSMESVFAASYAIVTQLSSKPVMITETSSGESGGDKAAWIRSSFMTTIPQDFPRVTAVIWFNKAQEEDWRINSSQASLDAYRSVVSCSLYGGSGPCEGAAAEEQPTDTGGRPKKEKKPQVQGVHVSETVGARAQGALSYGVTQPGEVELRVVRKGWWHRAVVIKRHTSRGHHRLRLRHVLRRRRLALGRYRLVITARNRRGQRSHPHRAHFRVVRKRA